MFRKFNNHNRQSEVPFVKLVNPIHRWEGLWVKRGGGGSVALSTPGELPPSLLPGEVGQARSSERRFHGYREAASGSLRAAPGAPPPFINHPETHPFLLAASSSQDCQIYNLAVDLTIFKSPKMVWMFYPKFTWFPINRYNINTSIGNCQQTIWFQELLSNSALKDPL